MSTRFFKRCTALALAAMVVGSVGVGGCASSEPPKTAPAPARAPSPTAAATPAAAGLPRNARLEEYIASTRADLSRGKVGLINNVMRLRDDEAKEFWPIYERYESELFDLGDERLDAIRRFATALRDRQLTDPQARELAARYFDFERKRLDLLQTYHDEIATALSPVRAAQFTQIEHRTGNVVDVLIASEIPLIQPATAASNRQEKP